MRTRIFSVALISLMLGSVWAGVQEADRFSGKTSEAPRLRVSGTNVVDIGAITDRMVTNVPFRVVNSGTFPVKITRLVPTCSCITATASTTNVVPPGGDVIIHMIMDPRMVRGDFTRSLWICADDSDEPRLQLALTGTVAPLFSGVPIEPIALKLAKDGSPTTNRLILAATVPGVSLGKPEVVSNSDGLSVTLGVVARTEKTAQYEVTVVTAAALPGRHALVVQMPVFGAVDMSPLVFRFQTAAEDNLMAFPPRVTLKAGSQPQTYRVILRGAWKDLLLPAKLTWDLNKDGIRIRSLQGRKKNELQVRIDVSPDAAETMCLDKRFSVSFAYPGYAPVGVAFVCPATDRRGGG